VADHLTPYELSQALVGREIRYVSGRLEGRAGAERFTTLSIRLDDGRVLVVTPEGSRLVIDLMSPD